MALRNTRFFFLDCQTTGMHPRSGHLLEIAWGVGSADQAEPLKIESHLVLLPNDQTIPFQIQSITGIRNTDMKDAVSLETVYKKLKQLTLEEPNLAAVIHYAQFERPFLLDMFTQFEPTEKVPFESVCSAQISRRLFPSIPSRNIRAIAGYFGTTGGELKRASSHVAATFQIWKELVTKLSEQGIDELGDLQNWLQEKPKEKNKKAAEKPKYDYRVNKEMRLALPDCPGIYRMLSKTGEVLYVGKATSLKSRVNSYFRGQKNRDRKKLEMLSQVWDIRVTECGSALEAALLETDEIKRLDPPYNVSLKGQRHPPIFYSYDFLGMSVEQNKNHPVGPFRGSGPLEHLRILRQLLAAQRPPQVFYIDIEDAVLHRGFVLFCEQHKLSPQDFQNVRKPLAFGLLQFRKQLRDSKLEEEAMEEELLLAEESESAGEVEEILTPEDIADKFFRLLLRAAAEYRRSRILTKLLNSKVSWETKAGWSFLEVDQGQISGENSKLAEEQHQWPWKNLDLRDYDRMSVLLSELSKHPHRIEPRRSAL